MLPRILDGMDPKDADDLKADPTYLAWMAGDDVCAGGLGVVEGSAAAAIRAGVSAAIVVSFRPAARRQLRLAGPDRDRPVRASASADASSLASSSRIVVPSFS